MVIAPALLEKESGGHSRAEIRDVPCRVLSHEPLTPFVRRLECEGDVARSARTGQFVLLFPPRDSILLGRPFALAERTERSFAVWYMVLGRGTLALTELKPGDFVRVRGPIGNSFPDPEPNASLRIVMGAVGAAALTLDCPRKAEFHLGVPNVSWKPFAEMLSRRLEACEQSLRVFSEDGAIGEKGNALDGLPEDLSPSDRIWGCGTNGMMKALALKYKNRLSQIFMSLDAKMACGYGGCLGCVIDTVHGKKRACADGPVFRGDEVVWDAV